MGKKKIKSSIQKTSNPNRNDRFSFTPYKHPFLESSEACSTKKKATTKKKEVIGSTKQRAQHRCVVSQDNGKRSHRMPCHRAVPNRKRWRPPGGTSPKGWGKRVRKPHRHQESTQPKKADSY